MPDDGLSGRRRCHSARRALEERSPEEKLKLVEYLRGSRLSNPYSLGGSRDPPLRSEPDKQFEVAQAQAAGQLVQIDHHWL
jgi:hypothetical protein